MTSFDIEDSIINVRRDLFDFAASNNKNVNNNPVIAGIDEAGYGPWAGPVVACAVVINRAKFDKDIFECITDSKKLSRVKREYLYDEIIALQGDVFDIGVGIVDAPEIDDINILQANYKAMETAVRGLLQKPSHILVDGIRAPNSFSQEYMVKTIKGGDALSYSIATASIVAKVTRDKIMSDLAKDYPAYGWGSNAGYGTKIHMDAIKEYGVTEHHRKSYKPIKKIMGQKL